MQEYHNNIKETKLTIDKNVWLHTGDLGKYKDGYLTITGRKKELFKKSTGEYVPPIPLEKDLEKLEGVETAVVIADNRTFVTALLFPDFENLDKIKTKAGMQKVNNENFIKSEYFTGLLREKISKINIHHHSCERIIDFRVINKQVSMEGGELTPTMKVRRFHIKKVYKQLIDEMFKTIHSWK